VRARSASFPVCACAEPSGQRHPRAGAAESLQELRSTSKLPREGGDAAYLFIGLPRVNLDLHHLPAKFSPPAKESHPLRRRSRAAHGSVELGVMRALFFLASRREIGRYADGVHRSAPTAVRPDTAPARHHCAYDEGPWSSSSPLLGARSLERTLGGLQEIQSQARGKQQIDLSFPHKDNGPASYDSKDFDHRFVIGLGLIYLTRRAPYVPSM
jgi:hypothetical protein